MTRAKWVALAVGLVVMAVLVTNGPALWRAVGYEEERREDFVMGSWFDGERPDYVMFIRKRFSWLPGPDRFARCAWCVESDHLKCPRDIYWPESSQVGAEVPPPRWRVSTINSPMINVVKFGCDCPHPSHAKDE